MKILDDNYRWVTAGDALLQQQRPLNVYLLTRFNLKFWKKTKNGMDTRSAEWLSRRFELFETYCVPSVANQTEKQFLWFCLFADDTPVGWLDRLVDVRKRCKQFYPLLLSDEEGQDHETVIACFLETIHSQGQMVITLRIDNDDAIANDFIEKAVVVANHQKENKAVYWYEKGIQYYHHKKVAFVYKAPHNHYPFLVVKNSCEGERNILAFSHRGNLPEEYGRSVIPVSNAMWMEVIHDDNVMNEVCLTLRQYPFMDEKNFHRRFVHAPLNTRFHHLFTFLVPRMMKHFIRRINEKLMGHQ